MNHPLRCRCGSVQGHVAEPQRAMARAVCYCKDCQAYAHFLGRAHGGTDVIAIHPQHVALTQGLDALACMALSPRGLLRWYANCCRTPIGNTSRNPKTAYVGLVHTCLEGAGVPIERSFGPVGMRLNTTSAAARALARCAAQHDAHRRHAARRAHQRQLQTLAVLRCHERHAGTGAAHVDQGRA
jgi:hypothetical protein